MSGTKITPLAIYGAIGTTYGFGKDIVDLIQNISAHDDDTKDLLNQVSDNRQRLDIMVTTFEEIREYLDPKHRFFIEELILDVRKEVDTITVKLKSCSRFQWPLFKETLTAAVGTLSEWVRRFEARVVMLPDELKKIFQDKTVSDAYKAGRGGIFAALNAHIAMKSTQLDLDNVDPDKMLSTRRPEPPDEETRDVRRVRYRKDLIYIPQHIQEDPVQLRSFMIEVAKLTAVLNAANAKLTHLPKALSWFQQPDERGSVPHLLGIAYKIEDDVVNERTLKATITLGQPQHSLTDRIQLAVDFVSAMAYVRGLEWVHKGIRSENVLLCYGRNDGSAPRKLGRVNLIGFSIARRGTGKVVSTSLDNERSWTTQIYSHPERQTISKMADDIRDGETLCRDRESSSRYYRYMHDVYSVGVVLLEIGLWEDLALAEQLRTAAPEDRKRFLLQRATNELPIKVGKKYAEVVRACLEADDERPQVGEILSKLALIQI